MHIQPSTPESYPEIDALYQVVITHHRAKGHRVWEAVDQRALSQEIREGTHYSLWHEGQLVGVFALCYSDPIIWGEREQGDALYIHRIAIHPDMRGTGLFQMMMGWIENHAKAHSLRYIRMGSWAENHQIIAYYQRMGFDKVGQRVIPEVVLEIRTVC